MRALTVAVALALAAAPACAAELNVISAGAVRHVISGMIDDYARQTGVKFNFTVGPTGLLRRVIAAGEPGDLIIASGGLMAELEKTGKMLPGSRTDLGRVGLGLVVRAGAPAPDISTAEAFKRALLDARSIAYTDPAAGGVSYLHLMRLAERFGIKDAVLAKGVHATGGNDAVAKVAEGAAEIAIVLISEIHHPGARLAAPLPVELQNYTLYAAAVPSASRDPAAARAFVAALGGAGMAQRWRDAGFEPPN
jgi:molybdate transport system substrate-binding protein